MRKSPVCLLQAILHDAGGKKSRRESSLCIKVILYDVDRKNLRRESY